MVGAITHFQSQAASLPVAWLARSAPSPEAVMTCAGAAAFSPSSRTPFMAKDAGAFTLQRPSSSCVVEAGQYQSHSLISVSLGAHGQVLSVFSSDFERVQFAASRPDNTPDRLAEQVIGAFHLSNPMQLLQTSVAGALGQ